MSEHDDPHAVRWYRRWIKRDFRKEWGRWHWTDDADMTVCGIRIRIGIEGGSFLPETDDEVQTVTCKRCLAVLSRRRDDAEQT